MVISNALRIMPSPEKALAEIRRVLKPDGILIAPIFTVADACQMEHAVSRESYETLKNLVAETMKGK